MRVLPLENEEINECWISDRDRFSYEGLNSEERLTKPMLREGGTWREVQWQEALEYVAKRLMAIGSQHGAEQIGALASPHATLEEMALLAKLVRGLGSENVDFRLRQTDFSLDGKRAGAPWLGMNIAELGGLDRVLVAGSFLRKDHPLIANRLRQAAKRGQQVNLIHVADDDPLIVLANKIVCAPKSMPGMLAQVVRAAAEATGKPVPPLATGASVGAEAKAMAASLVSGAKVGLFLGNSAQQHPQAARVHMLVQALAEVLGARFGYLGEAANSVGGYIAQCTPGERGLNAQSMLASPLKAYLLLGVEPELDCANPRGAMNAMCAAEFVVALTAYRSRATEYAHVLLPIAPFTETSGSFINTEGRMQSFNGVVRPLEDARPAWKVLRVLGNLAGLARFEYDTSEQVRDETCKPDAVAARLDNRAAGIESGIESGLESGPEFVQQAQSAGGLQRIADVPIYFADPIVRRAVSLQQTRDARMPRAWINPALAARLGVAAGARVRVRQEGGEAVLELACDERLPADCVRIAAGHPATASLGAMFGEITSVERA